MWRSVSGAGGRIRCRHARALGLPSPGQPLAPDAVALGVVATLTTGLLNEIRAVLVVAGLATVRQHCVSSSPSGAGRRSSWRHVLIICAVRPLGLGRGSGGAGQQQCGLGATLGASSAGEAHLDPPSVAAGRDRRRCPASRRGSRPVRPPGQRPARRQSPGPGRRCRRSSPPRPPNPLMCPPPSNDTTARIKPRSSSSRGLSLGLTKQRLSVNIQ
jgi:hypothetical protein